VEKISICHALYCRKITSLTRKLNFNKSLSDHFSQSITLSGELSISHMKISDAKSSDKTLSDQTPQGLANNLSRFV
jgi:hypothetical protein